MEFKEKQHLPVQKQTSLDTTIPSKDKIKIGITVQIVQKQDQDTGNLTEGIVKRHLTNGNVHPHGIKVELVNGEVGRVQNII